MSFSPFDPLEFKNTKVNDAALSALKREIRNILSSYVGWYDPFSELIQNSLDAVEARHSVEVAAGTQSAYKPCINILVDLDNNALTVSDNGVGLDEDQFKQFLAPNFSFKTGKTRGHKGVGATYVAYGFNYMRVDTKFPGFSASGRILNARTWLSNDAGSNPKVEPDSTPFPDARYATFDRGVSISVRFDQNTHPKALDWINATTADVWAKIFQIKTGIGSILENKNIEINISALHGGSTTTKQLRETGYLWLYKAAPKKARYRELVAEMDKLYTKHGANFKTPDKYSNLDFIYEHWSHDELEVMLASSLSPEDKAIIKKHTPSVSVEFGYTAKLWQKFNDELALRSGYKVLSSGIQLAANNMPQGETIQVPLNRNVGRQNQVHFLFHFDDYSPDLGRKGFHRELNDFAKDVAKSITENHLSKLRRNLKANTGISPDLVRQQAISDWKKEMLVHETEQPLLLKSQHFFLPTERVSIRSTPTREQDVIALFHQLVAGGVIRGITIMSTNERFTYDGLFRISFDLATNLYVYEEDSNPLGVPTETVDGLHGKVLDPMVLEYKYSLDGLIEDFDSQDKNIKDVDLCIVWETGDHFKERYGITSLLTPENASQRSYHGVTHYLSDLETNGKHCDLIVLNELIECLNDKDGCAAAQRIKYE